MDGERDEERGLELELELEVADRVPCRCSGDGLSLTRVAELAEEDATKLGVRIGSNRPCCASCRVRFTGRSASSVSKSPEVLLWI